MARIPVPPLATPSEWLRLSCVAPLLGRLRGDWFLRVTVADPVDNLEFASDPRQ